MRNLLIVFFLLSGYTVEAKHAPKWKERGFATAENGIRYKIISEGKGFPVPADCYVTCFLYMYDRTTKKFDPILSPQKGVGFDPKRGSVIELKEDLSHDGIIMAIKMLTKGGKGFFVIPPSLHNTGGDSTYCYINLISVAPRLEVVHPDVDTLRNDTINFVLVDPDKDKFGDTLFSSVKLLEAPRVIPCGLSLVMQVYKFQLSWFDNGVQHKDILVYVKCPDRYGKDYFVVGKTYVITAIPFMDSMKAGTKVSDQFPNETLERYMLLRIK